MPELKQPESITELARQYVSTNRRIERATVELASRCFRYLAEAIGDMAICDVGYAEAEQFQKWIVDTGRNKVTANIYVKAARPVFSWAIRRGYIDDNPFSGLKLFKIGRKLIRVYETWEFTEMMLNCSNLWRARLLLAKTAGLRRGEVLNLTVHDVNFEREIIYVQAKKETEHTWAWQPKSKDLRIVPLVEQLSSLLTKLLQQLPEGQPYLTLSAGRYRMIQVLRRIGKLGDRVRNCPDENWHKPFSQILKRSGVKRATFHDLRRTCITEWLENGLQPHEVMQLAGHSSVDTTMKYYAATRDSLLERARNISHEVIGARGLEPPTS